VESIRVDIEDLINKLECVKEDDFSTVELEIDNNSGMYRQLNIKAVSMMYEDPIEYGAIGESDIEL